MEDGVGDLFTSEESYDVFWPFFPIFGVLLLVHFMKFPIVKSTNQTNKSLFCLYPIPNKKTCPYIVQVLEFVEQLFDIRSRFPAVIG